MKPIEHIRRENLTLAIDELFDGNQTVAAAKMGKEKPTQINHWLGGVKNMSTPSARAIEKKWKLPEYWMDTEHSSGSNHVSIKSQISGKIERSLHSEASNVEPIRHRVNEAKVRRVFVVDGKAHGGMPERVWTDGDYPVGATDEYTDIATGDPHAFLVPVIGTSMTPRFNPGEYAFVSPSLEPHAGDDVLVRLATGETMIKKLVSLRGNVYELHSYNERDQGPLFFKFDDVSWIYYIGYPVPARMIKQIT